MWVAVAVVCGMSFLACAAATAKLILFVETSRFIIIEMTSKEDG
jgi:hypothetical protein